MFDRYVQSLYDSMAWIGLAVAIFTTLSASWLVPMIYGPSYAETAAVLSVQIWAGVAVSMSFVHSKWLLSEGLQKYGLVYTLAGACVNVGLNLVLIPRHGAVGAAWATLITQVGLLPIQLVLSQGAPQLRADVHEPGRPVSCAAGHACISSLSSRQTLVAIRLHSDHDSRVQEPGEPAACGAQAAPWPADHPNRLRWLFDACSARKKM